MEKREFEPRTLFQQETDQNMINSQCVNALPVELLPR